jgi:NAD(P)H dehydrogenase (quinone)
MLAIVGATGNIGDRVVDRLGNRGIAQRLIVRDPDRVSRPPGAEVFQMASYADAKAVGQALAGIDTLFMISAMDSMGVRRQSILNNKPMLPHNRVHQHIAMVAAAVAVGVKHIIYVSFVGAAEDATFLFGREHFHTEEYIKSTGVNYTFLRNCLYMDNAAAHASDDGVIRGPAGYGKVSWVARDDIADVAVAVLTGSGHEGQTYDVTGPEALSLAETAEIITSVTGRTVTYQMLSPHEVRLKRNAGRMEKWEAEYRALTGSGLCDEDVEIWISHYMQMATGEAAVVSDTVPRLTGHPAISLEEYMKKFPECYAHLVPK